MKHQVTSNYYFDYSPVFDPDGKYLYFFTNRNMQPVYSDMDNSFVYSNSTQIAAVPLTLEVKENPGELSQGIDAQLNRAIEWVNEKLKTYKGKPDHQDYEKR